MKLITKLRKADTAKKTEIWQAAAIATKTETGYSLTVNGISVNFHFATSVIEYAKQLGFNIVWEV